MSNDILKNIIYDFDTEKFIRFFREKNRDFAPRKEELTYYDDENFKNGLKLGEIKFVDAEELIICAFEVMQSLTERSGKKLQYEKAKLFLKETQYDTGIFIFYDQNENFRFSLIYANYLGTKRDWSNFRRFTYFVSKEFTNKTFLQRIGDGDFSSLEKIKDAFSVEKVTKEFYRDISYWYFWAIQKAEFPKDAEKEENGRNIAIIRLITRLIFIWFMRERKLIPGNLFDYQKIKQILKDISPGKTTYYKAILQNLFFATLNTRERKYRFQITGWKNISYMDHGVYRYQDYFVNSAEALRIFKDIPFLNGGLFDCLDRSSKQNNNQGEVRIDGFSDKEVGLKFPNFLFFSEETNADLNKDFGTKNKNYKVQGLINILSAYNFTIDENDPNDQEIALDPELLGKVFENLLASFNPETSSTARKATGSYYTPREIVDYMVTQSLKEYFKTHLKDIEELEKKLDVIFTNGNENNPFDERDTKNIVKLIDALRIVDPAVGSGAFPMGVLNKLVFILSKIDSENDLWKQAQINAIEKNISDPVIKRKLKEQIEKHFKEKNPDYGRKLHLIQKCIYGVDIQQIAVEIAKLRFFISLLVDEKIDKEKENWGIEALPNLDFKIMQGNSLIPEFMGINFDDEGKNNNGLLFEDESDQLIKIFQEKKNQFQNESDKRKKDELTEEIEDLIIQIFETKLQKQKANYFSQLKRIKDKFSTLPNEEQRNEMIAKEKQELYKKTGFDLVEVEKQLREFSSGYKTKPFFLWKLYFAEVFQGDNPGFDIVIANPPYIGYKGHKYIFDQIIKTEFGRKYFNREMDILYYFVHRGLDLLKKEGLLSFITTRYWFTADGAKKLREDIKRRANINQILNFGEQIIFEGAKGQHNSIFILNKKGMKENALKIKFINLTDDSLNFKLILQNNSNIKTKTKILPIEEIFDKSSGNIIFQTDGITVIKKIEDDSKALINYCTFFSGIKTGADKIFIFNKCDTERIKELNLNKNEIELFLKDFYKNSDIHPYYINPSSKKILLVRSKKDLGNENIYNYLNQFKTILYSRKARYGLMKNRLDLNQNDKFLKKFKKDKYKIIIPYRAKSVSFALTFNEFHSAEDIYYITIKEELSQCIDIKYILAILNSKLINYWYFYRGKKKGKILEFTISPLKRIPLIKISNDQQHTFITLVDQILAITKADDYLNDPEKQSKVKELEKEIDKLVYELYELTEEEITIVENI